MADLISAARMVRTAAEVAWRRARRGPQRAGWSFVIAMMAGTIIGMMVIPADAEGDSDGESGMQEATA
mgnify:CR=1 FL=1